MTRDARLLFLARAVRMFGYGALGVILVLYLAAAGLEAGAIGLLLTLTLVGDTVISLLLTTHADRIGRRRTLILGAALMAAAGLVFAGSTGFGILLVAATIGVLSPSGSEVGPFLPIEQASLTEVTPGARRTSIYAWYNLVGSIATASGALAAGVVVGALRAAGWAELDAFRAVLVGYAVLGLAMVPIVRLVSAAVEVPPVDTSIARRFGLHRSRGIVGRLAALFALDAFGGGLIIQSLLAFWFHERFGLPVEVLGAIFFGANLLAAVSAL
ncbi:MAG: MFS transporter, partial [Chloroflexota bacterium]